MQAKTANLHHTILKPSWDVFSVGTACRDDAGVLESSISWVEMAAIPCKIRAGTQS